MKTRERKSIEEYDNAMKSTLRIKKRNQNEKTTKVKHMSSNHSKKTRAIEHSM
jgi:hypothetical protein